MSTNSRPVTDHSPTQLTSSDERTGGDVLVVIAFLAAFVILCVLGLASFVIGFFSR